MRCGYVSDLHLETQDFPWPFKGGDVLVIAGDLCHARALDPARPDKYSQDQRTRVLRFIDKATAAFAHVLLIAGNHDHYDGIFEDTVATLRRELPGVTVLDDSAVNIEGTRFFGTTLWSDFEGGSTGAMNGVRRRMGEFFFVKTRTRDAEDRESLIKFQPEHALAAHRRAWAALSADIENTADARPTIVVSHHAPSRKGLNPFHSGNGLDGAYASDLDARIAALPNVSVWIHGHTHIRRAYEIGATRVLTNCRGFDGRDGGARSFQPDAFVDA